MLIKLSETEGSSVQCPHETKSYLGGEKHSDFLEALIWYLDKGCYGTEGEIPQISSPHMSLGVHFLNCNIGLILSSLVYCKSQVK